MRAKIYYEWYKSSSFPFRDTIEISGIKYIYEWIPREVEIAKQLVSARISEKEAKNQISKIDNALNFRFYLLLPQAGVDILSYQLTDGENSTTRTQYFAFEMQEDIFLKTSNSDSLKCQGFMLERGMSNYPLSKFEFFYVEKNRKELKALYYFDRIFSKKYIEFDLTRIAKTKVPSLII